MEPILFSTQEICRLVRVHRNTLGKWVKAGWITPYRKKGRNSYFYSRKHLLQVLRLAYPLPGELKGTRRSLDRLLEVSRGLKEAGGNICRNGSEPRET